jgi:outer membrane biosynthesis protein TonB
MTDFSTEILPEEEEKVEALLPGQKDAAEARKALETPEEAQGRPGPALASAGNARLARQLGNQITDAKKPEPPAPRNGQQPELTATPDKPLPEMAAKPAPVPVPEKEPQPDPMLKEQAEQPKADPAAERQGRLKLLTLTLSRLLQTPERAPIEALFSAFLKAPMDEQADAALAIANAVLRIDADTRRRARIVLTSAMTARKSHPLSQILAIRLGAWVATRPAPPPPPDPGGGP